MASVKTFPPKNTKELRDIINLVEKTNPVIANMIEMISLTGLRYCDCSILKRKDVFINGSIRDHITVVQLKTFNKRLSLGMTLNAAKSSSQITIPLAEQAKKIIEDCIYLNPNCTLLFESDRNKGHPYSAQYINRLLDKVATKLNLKYPLGTHSFRKAFADMLDKNGASVHQIKDRLGHSSLASTDHYLSTFKNDADEMLAKIKF